MDISRFTKIAQQLTANEENVRLIALQKCNQMLADNNLTWETLLSKIPKSSLTPFSGGAFPDFAFFRAKPEPQAEPPQKTTKRIDTAHEPFPKTVEGIAHIMDDRVTRKGVPIMAIYLTEKPSPDPRYSAIEYSVINIFDQTTMNAIRNNPNNKIRLNLRKSRPPFPATGILAI